MINSYIVADKRVVPDVFLKVLDAKKCLASGECKTVNEAIVRANISRTAFYKYRDYVFSYEEKSDKRIYTLFFTLADICGILSYILQVLAKYNCNVLTINQNIPINEIANITISFKASSEFDLDILTDDLKSINGIHSIKLLGMDKRWEELIKSLIFN